MITAKPTKHLAGVEIEGEFLDLYELVESIHRIVGDTEDYDDRYWAVKNRLLGVCYDLRHAYMGDRNVSAVDNGVSDDIMRYHSVILPKNNVHYSVEVLFTEAMFVALSIPKVCEIGVVEYDSAKQAVKGDSRRPLPGSSVYQRDVALLQALRAVILSAFAEVVGEKALESLLELEGKSYLRFWDYYGQYVDCCNIEYINTEEAKRADKVRLISRRFLKDSVAYQKLCEAIEVAAEQYGCSVHEINDPETDEYPEFEW